MNTPEPLPHGLRAACARWRRLACLACWPWQGLATLFMLATLTAGPASPAWAQAVPAPRSAPAAPTALLIQEQLRQGRAAPALQMAEAALVAQPRDAALRFLRAVALMDLQRDTQATQAFTALAEEYPELPDPWNNLALLHVRAGQPERARQALEVALRNDPSHRTARLNLAEVYLMLAAQSWQLAAQTAALEPAQSQRLSVVRQLLSLPMGAR